MDFDYALPDSSIAKHPPANREDARLLHMADSGAIADRQIVDLTRLLPEGSALWVNETKVLHARMMAVKPTGRCLGVAVVGAQRPAGGAGAHVRFSCGVECHGWRSKKVEVRTNRCPR